MEKVTYGVGLWQKPGLDAGYGLLNSCIDLINFSKFIKYVFFFSGFSSNYDSTISDTLRKTHITNPMSNDRLPPSKSVPLLRKEVFCLTLLPNCNHHFNKMFGIAQTTYFPTQLGIHIHI